MPSNHGGRRKGAGRPPGAKRKAIIHAENVRKEVTDYCLETAEAVLAVAKSIALDAGNRPRDRIVAARVLLEYGVGRPLQQQEITVTGAKLEIRFLEEEEE